MGHIRHAPETYGSARAAKQYGLALPFEEHRALIRQLGTLETFLDFGPNDDLQPRLDHRFCLELNRLLGVLAHSLEVHFDHEETSSFFRTLPYEVPEFAAAIDRFGQEHGQLLRTVGSLLAASRRLRNANDLRVLMDRVKDLVGRLRSHERAENEILLAAYHTDRPGGD